MDGVTYYAVSSYLTTDISAPAQAAPTPAPAAETAPAEQAPVTTGFKTKFTDCYELITAKEIVNLRSKPSVTDADSQVVVTLYNGIAFPSIQVVDIELFSIFQAVRIPLQ